ncbi:MAG TPA: Rieske 2Fe-2S domain-containing protein [Rhodothermales bacterium]
MLALHVRRGGRFFLFAVLAFAFASCDSTDTGGNNTPEPSDGVSIVGNQIRIDLTSEKGSPLAAEGGYLYVSQSQTIVINVDGSYRAFSSTCTGDGCAVDRFVEARMVCSCDASAFSNNGLPMAGPARTPLARYAVTHSGNLVTVTRASSNPDPDPDPYPNPDPGPYGY